MRLQEAVKRARSEVRAGAVRAAVASLVEAAELYRGPLLAESLHDDAFCEERRSLQRTYRSALLDLATLYEEQESWARCVEVMDHYIGEDPYAEPAYRRLMLYHARRGDRAGVRSAFERCERSLSEGLDVEPGSDTIRLYRRLLGKH